jgi:hypothetical protein
MNQGAQLAWLFAIFLLLGAAIPAAAQERPDWAGKQSDGSRIRLFVRGDDFGNSHSSNVALGQSLEAGVRARYRLGFGSRSLGLRDMPAKAVISAPLTRSIVAAACLAQWSLLAQSGQRSILFDSDRSGRLEIYALDIETSAPPDGRSIVFASNRNGTQQVYIMAADGSNVRRLTSHPASDVHASW